MAPQSNRMGRALAAVALLTIAFLPIGAAAPDAGADCAYARFQDITAGSLTLYTAGGATTVQTRVKELAFGLAASTTGTVDVKVEHDCVRAYHMYVVKTGLGVIYDSWKYPNCLPGVDTHNVPIGLDLGEYTFYLEWYGCDGTKGTDKVTLIVFDPPLGV